MSLPAEQFSGTRESDGHDQTPVSLYQAELMTARGLTFDGKRPKSIRREQEWRILHRLRTVPPPTHHPAWRRLAKCATGDPELFFAGPGTIEAEQAKAAYCQPCAYRGDCLIAIAQKPEVGVWAGFDESERRSRQFIALSSLMIAENTAI